MFFNKIQKCKSIELILNKSHYLLYRRQKILVLDFLSPSFFSWKKFTNPIQIRRFSFFFLP